MAVREFDGVDDKIVLGTTGAEIANGGYSVVMLIKPATITNGQTFLALRSSGQLVGSLSDAGTGGGSSGKLETDTEVDGVTAPCGVTAGDWQILGYTKAAGTSAVRFHRYLLGGGWTHANSGGTLPDAAGVVDQVIVAASNANNAAGAHGCRVAVAALLPALADADVEAIASLATSQFVADLGAYDVWEFDQADVGTTVADKAGSSNQQTIVGTSVVTGDDPPGWTFGITVIPPLDFSIRLSGGAANANPDASIGGAVSSVNAGASLFDNVTNGERTAGLVDYRLVYVHNDDSADGSVVAYVPSNLEAGREIAVGVPTQAAGVTVTAVSNDQTAPAGVTFSAPTTAGAGLSLGTIPAGSYRGLWLRRTVASGTAVDPTNSATVRLEIARTS
jgi:hypothetical protein